MFERTHRGVGGGGGGNLKGDVPAKIVLWPLVPEPDPSVIEKLLAFLKKKVIARDSYSSVNEVGSVGLSAPVPVAVASNLVRPSGSCATAICVLSASLYRSKLLTTPYSIAFPDVPWSKS